MEIKAYEHKVQYYETDQMKVVHHSNYIRWFEEARTYWLEKIGMPYGEMERMGIIIPVLEVSAKYKKMVLYGQTVEIKIKIEQFNGVKAKFSYEVYEKESGELCTTGYSLHCFLDADMKPMHLKKKYNDVYQLFMANL